jgi:predicted amidohydrolase
MEAVPVAKPADTLDIALVQPRLHWRNPAANREHLEQMVRSAAGADLYVLPETFTTGFLGDAPDGGEDMDGPTLAWMRQLAHDTNAAITGSAAIDSPQGRRNRLLFVTPAGEVHIYDKRHLFSFAGEDQRYVAGSERVLFEFRGWRICPQICYDIRFPVWCRNRGDYDLLLVVANWPAARVSAWDTLLRARAIENQAFVVAVNRVGEDGKGVAYPGHSALYDPLGEAVLAPWKEEGCRSGQISLQRLREVREQFPFSRDADGFVLI